MRNKMIFDESPKLVEMGAKVRICFDVIEVEVPER